MRRSLDWIDWRPTLVAAGLVVVAVALLIVAFESVSAFERPQVLASMIETIYWMAGGFIGACGTIAALTLTTLSLMEHLETRRMGPRFLVHMRLTVLGAFATIALSVGALLLTIFPSASGSDTSPPMWQVNTVYYSLLALTALMVGGFAVVLTSLYATISDVFHNLPARWVDEIMAKDEEDEELSDAIPQRAEVAADRAEDAADQAEGAAERAEEAAQRDGRADADRLQPIAR